MFPWVCPSPTASLSEPCRNGLRAPFRPAARDGHSCRASLPGGTFPAKIFPFISPSSSFHVIHLLFVSNVTLNICASNSHTSPVSGLLLKPDRFPESKPAPPVLARIGMLGTARTAPICHTQRNRNFVPCPSPGKHAGAFRKPHMPLSRTKKGGADSAAPPKAAPSGAP